MQNWNRYIQMQKQLINRALIVDEAVSTQNIPFYFRERAARNSGSHLDLSYKNVIFKSKKYVIIKSKGCEKMKKILIIEDEKIVSNKLKELLDGSGYNAIILKEFRNVLKEIELINPDLILLDINLPEVNGEILLQNIRKKSKIPVIMLTSKCNESDEIISMSFGADDYITKPYNPTILLLRINNIFKRLENNNAIYTYKDLSIDIKRGIIKKQDTEILLTKNEILILNFLLNNQGKIISRDDLITELWSNSEFVNDNTLTVNISRLRNKLKELGYEEAIETKKGMGYILL